jgi:sigma54-dependent transcription regulator
VATKAETIKIGPEIDKELYFEFARIAQENGQSQRYLLEKAMRHYIQFIAPSQSTVRPEVMTHFRRSVEKNRELHKHLARE